MAEIYVTGHRNPDLDSTCSSYCYAHLKNKIDRDNTYIPVRCGSMNQQTKAVFKRFKISPPKMLKDVYPKALDVVRKDRILLDADQPVLRAIRLLDTKNVSVLPVFEDDGQRRFYGTISINEISHFFIRENTGERPVYSFLIDNFESVLPGFLLKRGTPEQFSAPIMTGAMPYERGIERLQDLLPQKPIVIVGMRLDMLEYACKQQLPAIILTGVNDGEKIDFDFSGFHGTVFISKIDTAETIRLVRLSTSIRELALDKPKRIDSSEHFDDVKNRLVNSVYRGLPIFSGDQFEGLVTRRCFIEKPKKELILVDHNEISQSIPGADQAHILEIIDHHRLAPQKTVQPIYVYNKPVGSTCTIVYHHFRVHHIQPGKKIAGLLLSGILSDTVLLKSPTTTREDRETVSALEKLSGLDRETYGEEVFSQTAILHSEPPRDLVTGDFKTYTEFDVSFGIGQVEVVTFAEVPEVKDSILEVLESICLEQRLDWTMLLITHVIKENSMLLSSPFPEGEKRLVYAQISDHLFELPGVLSRKKQLLPEVLRVLEEISNA